MTEKEKAEQRAEQLEIIRQFRLIDDTFMAKVFEDKECAELLLRVILDREDLTVVKVVSQFEIKNLQGRSSRLDIFAVDEQGKQYDVEVQRADEGANPERARYYSSLIDANSILPSEKFADLPENYVIFITENDVLKGGKPIYTINRKIEELDNAIFNDGSHIIYVNGEIRDESKLGKLMQDFFSRDPHKMHNKALSERTRFFKESEGGVHNMCKLMEDYVEKYAKRAEAEAFAAAKEYAEKAAKEYAEKAAVEATKEATKKASAENSKKFAFALWDDGMRDMEKIAKLTDLPISDVKKLFEGEKA